jgi:hypothetical protein
MKKIRLSVTVMTMLLAGCSINKQPYPRYWPPMVMNQTDCPDLSGRYQNQNTECKGADCEYLSSRFSFLGNTRFGAAEAELQGPNEEQLTIRYQAVGSTSGATFSLKRGADFQCEGGQVVLEEPGEFMSGDGAFGRRGMTRRYFSRTVDGSLVMRKAGSAGGIVFLIIPVYLSGETWTRWAPIEK